MDQPKLERLLRLMKMLTANTAYTVDDLAERLAMSRRTVYRYIDTFRAAGFVIKKSGDCIRLDKESPHFREISQLVHFTEEEAVILRRAIESIDDTNLLKQNLKRKLYSVYDNKTLAQTVVRGRHAPNIHALIGAIEQRRQVILKSYQSAHGNAVRDRRVEPFAFTTNYVRVVLRHGGQCLQALQNIPHRWGRDDRGSVAARSGTPRRVHRHLSHARRTPAPREARTGHTGL